MMNLVLTIAVLIAPAHAAELDFSDAANPPTPPATALGYPSRAADLDALAGFRDPPPGYGQVPFWW